MSIAKFQTIISNKGCAGAIGITMASVFILGSFYQCNQAGQMGQAGNPTQANSAIVVTVAGKGVTGASIDAAIAQQESQMGMGTLPPEQVASLAGFALSNALQGAAMDAVAAKNGVEFTEPMIKTAFDKQFQSAVDQYRQRMEMDKKLKPGATEAEFDALVLKQEKKSLKQLKDDSWKSLSEALLDPQKKPQVLQSFAQPLVLDALAAKMAPSDSELVSTYNNLTVKRILIKDENGKSAISEAERIRAEILGGLKFEAAMDRYSKEVPEANKRVSEKTLNVTGAQFTEDAYRPLATLKAGEYSVPTTTPEGVVIYKVVSIKSALPPDFEKSKAKYREQLAKSRAEAELRRQTEAILKGPDVKWSNSAYEALYKLSSGGQGATDPKDRQANLESVATLAESALSKAQGPERRIASLALFGALQQLATIPGVDAKALADRKINAINTVLESSEDGALRLQLVDLYVEKGDKVGASGSLLKAAEYNSDYTPVGQTRKEDQQAKLKTLTDKKMIDAEAVAAINKEFQRWIREKVEFDKQQAEQRKADEAAAKKAAEDAKAEAAKAKVKPGDKQPAEPKSDYAPTTPSTQPPANPPKTGG